MLIVCSHRLTFVSASPSSSVLFLYTADWDVPTSVPVVLEACYEDYGYAATPQSSLLGVL